jgi:hypothetical protein
MLFLACSNILIINHLKLKFKIMATKEGMAILKCTCQHEFQDQQYGKGMRAHNINSTGEAYCTVCTPRRLNCEKNGVAIDANPMLKQMYIPACKPRQAKRIA